MRPCGCLPSYIFLGPNCVKFYEVTKRPRLIHKSPIMLSEKGCTYRVYEDPESNGLWQIKQVLYGDGQERVKILLYLLIWFGVKCVERKACFTRQREIFCSEKHQIHFKGTQEWEFFWLRFWILSHFIVSYAWRYTRLRIFLTPILEFALFLC